jgi:hypothetical protein
VSKIHLEVKIFSNCPSGVAGYFTSTSTASSVSDSIQISFPLRLKPKQLAEQLTIGGRKAQSIFLLTFIQGSITMQLLSHTGL